LHGGSLCKLHVSVARDLLLRRRGNVLSGALDFIHQRFCLPRREYFQSITGSATLLASSSASDTDGGGNECVQTF
jgi:hypothetical protein